MEIEVTIIYRELLRINPQDQQKIQSKGLSMGCCWSQRYLSKKMGNFIKLEFDHELSILIALTDIGKVYSSDGCKTWFENENGCPIS